MKKFNTVLLTVFSVGILICLFAGALSVVGYLVALCIGGESATALCTFVFKAYLPWVIKVTSVIVGIGLIAMYTTKQKALTLQSDEEQKC